MIYALVAPQQAADFFGWLRPALTSTFDGFFLSAANIFVLFCLSLIVLPVGSVRLGGADATPDYGYLGWFAMLFAAGMGIGLMFFGVSGAGLLLRHTLGGRTIGCGTSVHRGWRSNSGKRGRCQAHGVGRNFIPLGTPPLGYLRRCCARTGAVQL